jgi:predicted amidohydrolase
MDAIQKQLLEQVADLHGVPSGAYSIRVNGRLDSKASSENITIVQKTDKPGIDIYIAPTAGSRKEWQSTVRHIAQEGRCFVLSCNQFVTRDMYPDCVKTLLDGKTQEICPGGSCIISPTGKYIADAVYHREEVIIATLDMTQVAAARLDFDPCGHYSRPDILSLSIK